MREIFLTFKTYVILVGAILIFQITGCTKEQKPVPSTSYSIVGLWTGTYTVNGQPALGEQYFSFVIKPDGTMINDTKWANSQHLNIGTWNLTGDSLSCTATCVYGLPSNVGITERHTAVFDKTTGKLTNGIWRNIPPLTGSGTFTLTKAGCNAVMPN